MQFSNDDIKIISIKIYLRAAFDSFNLINFYYLLNTTISQYKIYNIDRHIQYYINILMNDFKMEDDTYCKIRGKFSAQRKYKKYWNNLYMKLCYLAFGVSDNITIDKFTNDIKTVEISRIKKIYIDIKLRKFLADEEKKRVPNGIFHISNITTGVCGTLSILLLWSLFYYVMDGSTKSLPILLYVCLILSIILMICIIVLGCFMFIYNDMCLFQYKLYTLCNVMEKYINETISVVKYESDGLQMMYLNDK